MIKPFDGNLSNWNEFISMFKELIHGSSKYTDIKKFCHLKSYLTGNAATVIAAIDFLLTNYAQA